MSWWLSTSSLCASILRMTPWQFCRMGDGETRAHVNEAKNCGYPNNNFSVDSDAWPLAGKIPRIRETTGSAASNTVCFCIRKQYMTKGLVKG